MHKLKVENLDGRKSGKAIVRLKGKWLANKFKPNTYVQVVELPDGSLLIKPIDTVVNHL